MSLFNTFNYAKLFKMEKWNNKKYIVMLQVGNSPGGWIKAFGPSSYQMCQAFASNRREPTQIVPA